MPLAIGKILNFSAKMNELGSSNEDWCIKEDSEGSGEREVQL